MTREDLERIADGWYLKRWRGGKRPAEYQSPMIDELVRLARIGLGLEEWSEVANPDSAIRWAYRRLAGEDDAG